MRLLTLPLTLLASWGAPVLASCGYGTFLQPRQADDEQVPINTFGYSGDNGPTNWIALDPANVLCSTGTRQSPIDMVENVFEVLPGDSISLQISDMMEGAKLENLGTTVEVVAEGGSMTVAGKDFTLQQFHFHLPSEHLENGTSMAMEMHMVFQSADDQIAVIGVFIDVVDVNVEAGIPVPELAKRDAGDRQRDEHVSASKRENAGGRKHGHTTAFKRENAGGRKHGHTTAFRRENAGGRKHGHTTAFKRDETGGTHSEKLQSRQSTPDASLSTVLLQTVFGAVQEITQPGTLTITPPLFLSDIVAALTTGSFQSYMGSLTTPPCTEEVTWLVATEHLSVLPSSFDIVRNVIGFNSRFPQNLPGEPNLLQLATQLAVS